MWRVFPVLLLAAAIANADGIPITGRILGADGNPVAGVEFGVEWHNPAGKLLPRQRWKPGSDGGFTNEFHWNGRPMAFMALDPAGRNGALRIVTDKELVAPMKMEMTLQPFVRTSGSLACPTIGPKLGVTTVIVKAKPSGAEIYHLTLDNDKFDVPLPPGDYDLVAAAYDAKDLKSTFHVPDDGKPVNLGALELEPTALARAWGGPPPPLAITAARGLGADFKLADAKGQWVVLVFWNARMPDAARVVLEQLKEIATRRAADAPRFRILTFYDPCAKNLADYDAEIAPLTKGLWKDGAPPFPVLLDSTGETWKAWGVGTEPLSVLIDPDGNVVRKGDHHNLEEKLDEKPAGK